MRNINWLACRKCGKQGLTNDCGCPEPPAKPDPNKQDRRDSDKKKK